MGAWVWNTIQWNLSNPDTNGAEESVIVSEVSSFQRLKEWYILGVGKGVLFREVSSVQECPHRERGSIHSIHIPIKIININFVVSIFNSNCLQK